MIREDFRYEKNSWRISENLIIKPYLEYQKFRPKLDYNIKTKQMLFSITNNIIKNTILHFNSSITYFIYVQTLSSI